MELINKWKKLLQQCIQCPEVYGDPALLYPRFYNPSIQKKYKYGIVPHYVDWDNEIIEKFKNREDEGIKVINILNENVNQFVDEVLECEIILSFVKRRNQIDVWSDGFIWFVQYRKYYNKWFTEDFN